MTSLITGLGSTNLACVANVAALLLGQSLAPLVAQFMTVKSDAKRPSQLSARPSTDAVRFARLLSAFGVIPFIGNHYLPGPVLTLPQSPVRVFVESGLAFPIHTGLVVYTRPSSPAVVYRDQSTALPTRTRQIHLEPTRTKHHQPATDYAVPAAGAGILVLVATASAAVSSRRTLKPATRTRRSAEKQGASQNDGDDAEDRTPPRDGQQPPHPNPPPSDPSQDGGVVVEDPVPANGRALHVSGSGAPPPPPPPGSGLDLGHPFGRRVKTFSQFILYVLHFCRRLLGNRARSLPAPSPQEDQEPPSIVRPVSKPPNSCLTKAPGFPLPCPAEPGISTASTCPRFAFPLPCFGDTSAGEAVRDMCPNIPALIPSAQANVTHPHTALRSMSWPDWVLQLSDQPLLDVLYQASEWVDVLELLFTFGIAVLPALYSIIISKTLPPPPPPPPSINVPGSGIPALEGSADRVVECEEAELAEAEAPRVLSVETLEVVEEPVVILQHISEVFLPPQSEEPIVSLGHMDDSIKAVTITDEICVGQLDNLQDSVQLPVKHINPDITYKVLESFIKSGQYQDVPSPQPDESMFLFGGVPMDEPATVTDFQFTEGCVVREISEDFMDFVELPVTIIDSSVTYEVLRPLVEPRAPYLSEEGIQTEFTNKCFLIESTNEEIEELPADASEQQDVAVLDDEESGSMECEAEPTTAALLEAYDKYRKNLFLETIPEETEDELITERIEESIPKPISPSAAQTIVDVMDDPTMESAMEELHVEEKTTLIQGEVTSEAAFSGTANSILPTFADPGDELELQTLADPSDTPNLYQPGLKLNISQAPSCSNAFPSSESDAHPMLRKGGSQDRFHIQLHLGSKSEMNIVKHSEDPGKRRNSDAGPGEPSTRPVPLLPGESCPRATGPSELLNSKASPIVEFPKSEQEIKAEAKLKLMTVLKRYISQSKPACEDLPQNIRPPSITVFTAHQENDVSASIWALNSLADGNDRPQAQVSSTDDTRHRSVPLQATVTSTSTAVLDVPQPDGHYAQSSLGSRSLRHSMWASPAPSEASTSMLPPLPPMFLDAAPSSRAHIISAPSPGHHNRSLSMNSPTMPPPDSLSHQMSAQEAVSSQDFRPSTHSHLTPVHANECETLREPNSALAPTLGHPGAAATHAPHTAIPRRLNGAAPDYVYKRPQQNPDHHSSPSHQGYSQSTVRSESVSVTRRGSHTRVDRRMPNHSHTPQPTISTRPASFMLPPRPRGLGPSTRAERRWRLEEARKLMNQRGVE